MLETVQTEPAKNGRTIQVSGPKLAKLRNRLALTQRELGEKIGVTETRVRHIERAESVGVYAPTFRKLAEATGMTVEQLRAAIGAGEAQAFAAGVKAGVEIKAASDAQNARWAAIDAADQAKLDANVEPFSERPVHEVPFFEARLAAGQWTDVSEIGQVFDPRGIDRGLFRVRIRGDSMAPVYLDGEVIEFRCLRPDRDGVIIGKDYYVQHADGEATFKRVADVTEDSLYLAALNRTKYPKRLRVERALVVRMARAIAVVRVIE